MLKPVEKPIKFKKNLETKGKSYPITHVEAVIDSEGKNISQMLTSLKKGLTLTEISSSDLKKQRDNGELITGAYYRITDVDGNAFPPDSPYYGKQLDVILVATSPNTLSEEGYAIAHNPDVYDVTFIDGTILKCYVHLYTDDSGVESVTIINCETKLGNVYHIGIVTVDEANKTAVLSRPVDDLTIPMEELVYDDFQGENLKAWKIWYCIDNDKERFPWAERDIPVFVCNTQNTLGTLSNVTITRNYDGDSDGRYGYIMNYEELVIPIQSDRELKDSGNYTVYFSENVSINTYVEILSSSVTANGHGVIYKVEKGDENSNITKVTWQELKNLRDNSHLTPGYLYRITDYNCTTTQENTQSAGHQFDIVLLALSEDKLAEEGWAMMHDNIYDVTFGDGVTKKCYVYKYFFEEEWWYNFVDINTLLGTLFEDPMEEEVIVNEENKVVTTTIYSTFLNRDDLIYNYFQHSNLSAWKVWYCLDNDTERFAWAQDEELLYGVESGFSNGKPLKRCPSFDNDPAYGEFKYAWGTDADIADNDGTNFVYSKSEHINKGDTIMYQEHYDVISPSSSDVGRGVIYRLIDEFNNDVAYDFKNIQFKRTMADGEYDENGTDTWCYTFTWIDANGISTDASILCQNVVGEEGFVLGVHDNSMLSCIEYDFLPEDRSGKLAFALNDNVFISSYQFDGGTFYGIYGNHFGTSCYSNTFGNNCFNNIFGNDCCNNKFGNDCNINSFMNNFSFNSFMDGGYYNSFGNNCFNNTFESNISLKNYGNNNVELATKDDLN